MTKARRSAEYYRNARIVRRTLQPRIDAGDQVNCVNCRRPVQPGQRWDVGHIRDHAKGGTDHLNNLGAAHTRCNRSDGGKQGAIITHHTSRAARRLPNNW